MSNTTHSEKTIPEETIQTENLTASITRKPGCFIHLDIKVNAPAVMASYIEAEKKINKEVSIPGFRTGKAPKALITQRFGKQIKNEWHNIVLNVAFSEVLEASQLYPFQRDSQSITKAEVKKISKENGAELVIEFEARPEVPELNYTEMSLKPVNKREVTEELIDETIHQIQLHHGKWERVTDRAVMEGDFVDLDIEALENPPRSICQDMRFEVAPKQMGSWMRKLIIGKSVNETVEGVSEKEDSPYEVQIEEFIPTLCRITIKAVWKSELPPLDNELAEKVGLKAIDELRDRVREDLEIRAHKEQRDELRAQVEHLILEKYPFDIPFSIIERQSRDLIKNRLQQLKKHEHSAERLAEMSKEIEANTHNEIQNAYRLYFLTQKIATRENVNVYESEIYREGISKFADLGDSDALSNLQNEEVKSKLYVNILTRKVLDLIVDKISI